jgi:hypothetical protein
VPPLARLAQPVVRSVLLLPLPLQVLLVPQEALRRSSQ